MSDQKPSAPTAPTAADCPEANGMPMLGLGTWQLTDEQTCPRIVSEALEMGYRHVDTAQAYGNEHLVGDGIAQSDVDRDDIFLATKLWIDDLSYENALEAAHDAVDNLGVDCVDLLYVHWPAGEYDPAATFRALDELVDQGVTERYGVSNFEPRHIETASDYADHGIFANQVECHPLLQQEAVREACADHDIEVVAYSPLARGKVVGHETISNIAGAHGVSDVQVALAWLRHHGITAIPKTADSDHLHDNWSSLSLQLTDGEIADIDALAADDRQVSPDFAPWNRDVDESE
jgi:2,5-diketo-D-gluconate reductase B